MKTRELVSRHFLRAGLLASYPRSGSAMVRMALASVYGQKTGTCYDESKRSEAFKSAVNLTDENQHGIFYKTHDLAISHETCPVIVVVRDPRLVFPSLIRFYREANGAEYSMSEIVKGLHPWGDWSDWVLSWARYAPRDALWLHYESFEPDRVGAWYGFDRCGGMAKSLGQLHEADPLMFGTGRKEPEPSEYDDMIIARHGSVMTMLGYKR